VWSLNLVLADMLPYPVNEREFELMSLARDPSESSLNAKPPDKATACNQLTAFVNQVNSHVATGVLHKHRPTFSLVDLSGS
jgi:hypothetical protein